MFQNIANLTIENKAQSIKGFRAYILSVLDSVDSVRGKPLLENQVVFGYAFRKQGVIKRLVTNHFHHQDYFIILNLLTMLNILSIIEICGGVFRAVKNFLRRNKL